MSAADGARNNPNFVQNGTGGANSGNGGTGNLGAPVSGVFAAQAFAQEGSTGSIASFTPRDPKQAAAAYQTTESQTDPKGLSDVQLPGLPARLASGRALDLRA